jgi:hypothetical protein
VTVRDLRVLGIRHHGPGSARAVREALSALAPETVLIEGPPELDALIPLGSAPDLIPPVAALVYAIDEPKKAAFYPMAAFSPEWVALRWAVSHGVEVRFLDLPATNAVDLVDRPSGRDPIGELAAAAGYDDAERWWEDAIEHRYHGLEVFDVILDAMRAVRAGSDNDQFNARREAAMRRVLRGVLEDEEKGAVAVVCGAWHAPVLGPDAWPSAAADSKLLKGLTKTKVAATWVPWTSARLAFASGYGAGVTAPGWYHHLFTVPDDKVVTRWMIKAASLLRGQDLDASSAAVIDAVRLADSLAVIRGRPLAGLDELNEACRAVLGHGSDVPLQLIGQRLLVGDELGSVPDDTPMVPLARDLVRLQKRLRLKPSAMSQALDLDLRTESHRERSKLFHRLLVLDIPWAVPGSTGRTKGTFREGWVLEWKPELSVALVSASGNGTTIEAAADAAIRSQASSAESLSLLAGLVEQALLADLPGALGAVVDALMLRTAHQHDVPSLMAAIEPLARTSRYGDVRGPDTFAVHDVVDGMLTRITIGLPAACASLDDEAAASMADDIDGVQRSVGLLDDESMRDRWYGALAAVADRSGVHGLVGGRAVRLLLDAGRLLPDAAAVRLSLALSRGADHLAGAAWIDGFLTGDVLLLLYDAELLGVIDDWVTGVPDEVFDDVLPLLRRAFGRFENPERRQLGSHLRVGVAGPASSLETTELDPARADRVMPVLRRLLS